MCHQQQSVALIDICKKRLERLTDHHTPELEEAARRATLRMDTEWVAEERARTEKAFRWICNPQTGHRLTLAADTLRPMVLSLGHHFLEMSRAREDDSGALLLHSAFIFDMLAVHHFSFARRSKVKQ